MKTLLLVEDEAIIAMTEKMTLEKYGYSVIIANSGEKAFEAFEKNSRIDLVLMDIDLGNALDGTETAVKILKTHDVPIIFLSSHTEAQIVEKTEKITSYGYVVKNSSITVLNASIKMAFRLFDAKIKEKNNDRELIEAETKFRALFEKGPIGVAYHKMIYNQDDLPIDYFFLDANNSYRKMTGVDPRGKTVTQAFPGIDKDPFDWIGTYARVARTGEEIHFEQYFALNDRWYDCVAYQFKADHFVTAFVEITNRKKAELNLQIKNDEYEVLNKKLCASVEELQATNNDLLSEKIFTQAILESIPGYLYVYDDKGKLIRWNKKHEEMTGYSAEELSHKTIYSWFDVEDAKRVAATVESVFRDGYGDVEANLITKSGERIFVRSSGVPMILDGKKYFTGVGIDISAQKKTQDALLKAERRLEMMLQNIMEGMVTIDVQGQITYANVAAEHILGIDTDIVGKYYQSKEWKQLDLEGNPYPQDQLPLAIVLREKRVVMNLEHQVVSYDGERKWLSVNAAPLFDDKNELIGGIASFRDVTVLKQTEDALHKSNTYLNNLFDYANAPIITWDTSLQITRFNHAFEKLTGKKETAVLGKDLSFLFPPDTAASSMALIKKLPEEGRWETVEVPIMGGNGSVRTVLWNSAHIYSPDGKIVSTIAQGMDITERKNAEEEVLNNETWLGRMLDIVQYPALSIQEFLDYALNQALFLTGSKIGYIYHYNENKKEFILNTWSKDVLAECAVSNPSRRYDLETTGLWGEAVRQRRTIIINDFNVPNTFKKGIPSGHVSLSNFMTIPVFVKDEIVGVIGLANKESDYNERNVLQVSLLMDIAWKVTDRMKAEENVKALLADKELILKEVHHRIKNNMNSLYSLLVLQADNVKIPEAATALLDAASRVQSMLVLYTELYQASAFKELSMQQYLDPLVEGIVSNFSIGKKITINKRIDPSLLDIKKLQPLGIIINELITNSMKYAFIDREDGIITALVSLKGERVCVLVGDNGKGLPLTVDFENSTGFGLQLVGGLIKQLFGIIRIEREQGTQIIMEFDR